MKLQLKFIPAIVVSLIIALIGTVAAVSFVMPIWQAPWPLVLCGVIVITCLVYTFFNGYMSKGVAGLSRTKKIITAVFVMTYAALLTASIRGAQLHLGDNSFLFQSFVYLGTWLVIALSVFFIISLVLRYQVNTDSDLNVRKRKIILYALPCILIWVLYLIAYFPGVMSPDSLSNWRQAHTHEFSNWHPVVYTWFMMALLPLWHSPAIIAFAQIVICAVIFGYGVYRFERSGFKPWVLWLITGIFALAPFNMLTIILWKDILFSAFLMLFSICIFNIVTTRGQWLSHVGHLVLISLSSLGLMLLRNNGLPIFIVMIIFLLVTYRSYFKKTFVTGITVCAIYFIMTGPVYNYFDVKPAQANEALGIPTQQIANIISQDGELTQEQKNYFDRILPLELWTKKYNPYITDPIKFSDHYHAKVIYDNFGEYFEHWFSAVLQNPWLAIEAYIKQTSIVWQINIPKGGYSNSYATGISPNDWGLESKVISPMITHTVKTWVSFTEDKFRQPLWRPAFYTFGLLLMTFIAYLRNNLTAWLVIMPVLLNTGTLLAAIPAQDFRYMYSNALMIFFVILFAFLHYSSKKKTGDSI